MKPDANITLYHIGRMPNIGLEGAKVERFTPRIPRQKGKLENDTMPRVCAADTLEGCMLAHPVAGYYMDNFLESPFGSLTALEEQLHKFLETGIVGMWFRVYRLEVVERDLLTPDELHVLGYVPDCRETGEHWILSECEPAEVFYLVLEGMDQDPKTGQQTYRYQTYDSLEACGTGVELAWYNSVTRDMEEPSRAYSKEEAQTLYQQVEDAKRRDAEYVEPVRGNTYSVCP